MGRDATFLRVYQGCLVLGGAFAVFAALDVGLALTGIYAWGDTGQPLLRLVIGIAISVLAFVGAGLAWREREVHDLGGATFADSVIAVGFMLVGGLLLLGVLR